MTSHCVRAYRNSGHEVFVHYCVSNIPGAVARSSTIALTSVTLPFGLQIASKGIEKAARENSALAKGINFFY